MVEKSRLRGECCQVVLRFTSVSQKGHVISDNWWPDTGAHELLSAHPSGGSLTCPCTAGNIFLASWVCKMHIPTTPQLACHALSWGAFYIGKTGYLLESWCILIQSPVTAYSWMKTWRGGESWQWPKATFFWAIKALAGSLSPWMAAVTY